MLGTDLSVSYLYGRWDLPTATSVNATVNLPANGGFSGASSTSHVNLVYPEDARDRCGHGDSTSLDKLGGGSACGPSSR